tara:strand:- start:910 stop:1824 length:915 start_codon:yes stop_codon:yes gene_type:complete
METYYISDPKLGFKLSKTATTPTIETITPGGALETKLINECSSITSGSEILSVNNECFVGLSYTEATNKIKSFNERPIEITISSPKRVSPIRKITSEEMDRISKEETQKALKNLVKSQIDLSKEKENCDSSDEEDLIVTNSKLECEIDKLEDRCRMLEFKKLNTEIEFNEQISSIKKVHEPIILINDYILTANKFYDVKSEFYTNSSKEIYTKLEKIERDFNKSLKLINNGKKNISYMGCQILVDNYINKITEDFNKFSYRVKIFIFIKKILEWFQFISLIIILILIYINFHPIVMYVLDSFLS